MTPDGGLSTGYRPALEVLQATCCSRSSQSTYTDLHQAQAAPRVLGSTPVLTRRALDYSSDSGFSAKLTEFLSFSCQFSALDCAPNCAWQRLATKLPSFEHGRCAVARARIAPARSSGRPRYLRNAMVIHTARYRGAGRGCIRRTDRSHSIYPQCRRSIRGRPVISGRSVSTWITSE